MPKASLSTLGMSTVAGLDARARADLLLHRGVVSPEPDGDTVDVAATKALQANTVYGAWKTFARHVLSLRSGNLLLSFRPLTATVHVVRDCGSLAGSPRFKRVSPERLGPEARLEQLVQR